MKQETELNQANSPLSLSEAKIWMFFVIFFLEKDQTLCVPVLNFIWRQPKSTKIDPKP